MAEILQTERTIKEAITSSAAFIPGLIDTALNTFLGQMPDKGCPSAGELREGEQKAAAFLKRELLTQERLSSLSVEELSQERASSLALVFSSTARELHVLPPKEIVRLGPVRAGLAAAVGAALGMLLLTPLTRLLLGMRDVGVVLGAILGAFGMVALQSLAARSNRLRRWIQGGLAVGVAIEAAKLFVTRRVGGSLKRIVCYVMAGVLLQPTKSRYDRHAYKQDVQFAIEQWINQAIILLICFLTAKPQEEEGTVDHERVLGELARQIYALQSCSAEDLPVAAAELIQEAQNAGFEGLQGKPAFMADSADAEEAILTWSDSLREQYDRIGHIDKDDVVIVERPPVIISGNVLKPGLVRKHRKR